MFSGSIFAENLKKLSGNKAQNAIAKEIGIPETTLSKWKHGTEKSEPRASDLIRIAEKYHCSIDELLGIDVNTEAVSTAKICEYLVKIDNSLRGGVDYTISKDLEQSIALDGGIHPELRVGNGGYEYCTFSIYPNCHETESVINFLSQYIKVMLTDLDDSLKQECIRHLLDKVND